MARADRTRASVLASSTGEDSELEKTLEIAGKPGTRRAVAMRLGPGEPGSFTSLPDLAPGDRLEVSVEVEVTTDSSPPPLRVGQPYEFDPVVQGRLLLASSPEAVEVTKGHALSLSKVKTAKVSHTQHHAVLVLPNAGIRISDQGLPWSGSSYVNLVLDASHERAGSGQLLLVGENEEDGSVGGDKGRLNVVRIRPSSLVRPKTLRTVRLQADSVPVDPEKRTVLFSLPLKELRRSEQLSVRAVVKASAAHLAYPARFSTYILLADSPRQHDRGGGAKGVATLGGEVAEHNGANVTPGRSPAQIDRVGVLRIEQDAPPELFLNFVAVSGNPTKRLSADAKLRIEGGFLEAVRYPAALKG